MFTFSGFPARKRGEEVPWLFTSGQREEICRSYHGEGKKVTEVAAAYHVSRPTIYKIIRRGRQRDFSIHKSTNKRFCCLKYGINRLSKNEKEIEARLKTLEQVLEECPYMIEPFYSDNGKKYRADPEHHAFMTLCREHRIEQRFTKVKTDRTNGKAERVIKTIMKLWYQKTHFASSAHRKNELRRFINFYNGVKPHKGIGGLTPEEKLIQYLYPENL